MAAACCRSEARGVQRGGHAERSGAGCARSLRPESPGACCRFPHAQVRRWSPSDPSRSSQVTDVLRFGPGRLTDRVPCGDAAEAEALPDVAAALVQIAVDGPQLT